MLFPWDFFILFYSFFLCSLPTGYFQTTSLLHLSFFFMLDKVYCWCSLLCLFNFIHCILQHKMFYLVLLMISISLSVFLVLFMYCFPDFIKFSFWFLIGQWAFSKQLFWALVRQNADFYFVGVNYWKSFFFDVLTTWFVMFLKVLHCCLCTWSSHLIRSLVIDFRKERTSVNPLRNSLVLETFYGYACSTLLPFCWGKFSRMYVFSGIWEVRPGSDSLLFAFPRMEINAQVCMLPPNRKVRLVFAYAH